MRQKSAVELLAVCAGGRDEEAWDELLRRYRRPILRGIHRGLRRVGTAAVEEESDDLLQEVYCRLLDRGGRTLRRCRSDGDRGVAVYLGRIAERVVLDRARHRRAAKRLPRAAPQRPEPAGPAPVVPSAAPHPSPEEVLLHKEDLGRFIARVRSAVGGRRRRRNLRVVEMAFLEGMSSKEIAARLDGELRPASVDSLLHRLRRRLAAEGLRVVRP